MTLIFRLGLLSVWSLVLLESHISVDICFRIIHLVARPWLCCHDWDWSLVYDYLLSVLISW